MTTVISIKHCAMGAFIVSMTVGNQTFQFAYEAETLEDAACYVNNVIIALQNSGTTNIEVKLPQ